MIGNPSKATSSFRFVVAAATLMFIGVERSAATAQQPARGDASVPLTIAQVVSEGLSRNPRLVEARTDSELAALTLEAARDVFATKVLPGVSGVFGQQSLTNQNLGVGVSRRFATGAELRANIGATSYQNQLGTYYSGDTTFLVTQPLLRGFGSSANIRQIQAAATQVADAGRQLRRLEQEVAIAVAAAFYRVVIQQQVADSGRSGLSRARQLLDAANARFAVGRASKLDVFRAEQLAAQAEAQLLDHEAVIVDAKDELRRLLDRGPDYRFDVSGDVPAPPDPMVATVGVELALINRADLLAAGDALADAERALSAADNALRPQLDVGVAITRREAGPALSNAFGTNRFTVASVANVAMPLSRTQETLARQSARFLRDRRQRELDAKRREIELDVEGAIRNGQRLVRQLALADSQLEAARLEVELATLRFSRGLANTLDVVSAETAMLDALARQAALKADIAIAGYRVRAAVGILDPARDVR